MTNLGGFIETVPAAADTIALDTMVQAGTNNSAHSSIHAGSVAAACQNTDSFNTHYEFLPIEIRSNLTHPFYILKPVL